MEISFEGKNVLISGAAGHLGSQLVKAYCEAKASLLVLLDLTDKKRELEELKNQYKDIVDIRTYTADFRNIEDIKKVVAEINKDNIVIDILVNNAGINIIKKANEIDEEIWDRVVDTNLKGSFFLTKEIGYNSLINQKGNVIFIASQHGVVGNVMRTPYCSSKSGILGLVRALTAEWSAHGVRVNAVSPTFILYEDNKDFLMNPREKRNMLNKIPLHKYADAEDVSNAVLFISSDKASMITGHNLVVDGGYTCL
ncbi:MAG: SDR family oxidoreductase [Clostridium sp.]|nr:SDR family oxidoreductase [Clostridium sp.]